MRYELSDNEWSVIKPMLPNKPRGMPNVFWRRLGTDNGKRIEAAGAKSLSTGDVMPLGKDIIHSVTNPTSRHSCALHIYGGDLFDFPRSEWDPRTLEEHPLDVKSLSRIFGQS